MRVHITGASGSGTTTLGAALAAERGGTHLDADDFYWLPTDAPFTAKRDPADRLARLRAALVRPAVAVLSGSIMGWGAAVEDAFDLVVFLRLDAPTRVERLRARETARLGHADPAFLAWAAQYDAGPPAGRSLARHRAWLAERTCPVVEIAGDRTVAERVDVVVRALDGLDG